MAQLTVRFDDDLEERLLRAAERDGVSLNQAVVRILRRALGLESQRPDVVGDALDAFVGTWTAQDEEAVLDAVRWLDELPEPIA